jgi:hypothetical protein
VIIHQMVAGSQSRTGGAAGVLGVTVRVHPLFSEAPTRRE